MSVSLKQSYDIEYNGTANVARMDLFVDSAADLAGLTTFDSITLLQGSTAEDISTGDKYAMQTNGTWVKQPSENVFSNVYTKAEIDSMLYLYYTKTEADALFEWITVTITTDTLPLEFIADGSPLTAWSMLGNEQQTGTPTPDNPVMPTFCGVRTANLSPVSEFDKPTTYLTQYYPITLNEPLAAGTYTLSAEILAELGVTGARISFRKEDKTQEKAVTITIAESGRSSVTITLSNSAYYIYFYGNSNSSDVVAISYRNLMINSGSTALPYEPYGWKVPITCAGQTTPVYLGQTQTVRRIKKLVLTGEETWNELDGGIHRITLNGYMRENTNIPLCTHYAGATPVSGANSVNNLQVTFLVSASGNNYMYIRDRAYTSADNFKSYLAAQYAAGTPVTVWYVIAEPTTGIVNEPLAKIGDYADELHSTDAGVTIPTVKGQNTLTVDTELQPSEMTITGKIREVNENEQ